MRFLRGLALTLLGHASAWRIVGYNNVDDCRANRMTVYRNYEGEVNGGCISFDEKDNEGVECTQYWDGGADFTECTKSALMPRSVVVQANGPAQCTFYTGPTCEYPAWEASAGWEGCQIQPPSFGLYRSFKCTW